MKLGFFAILSFGLALSVIILGCSYFYFYAPNMEEANAQEEYAHQLTAEANKIQGANKRRIQASIMVNQANAQWNQIIATHSVPASLAAGGINVNESAYQLVIDVRQFRNSMQRALNKQLKVGGVTVISGPQIPFPGTEAASIVADYFNFPAIPFPVVIFDLGQVTVQGTFNQIKANMAAWSNMPNYLAVADGLTLTGTAPILTGTYNVSIVGYITGSVIYPAVKETAAPSASSPAPSGGGGGFAAGGGGGGGGGAVVGGGGGAPGGGGARQPRGAARPGG